MHSKKYLILFSLLICKFVIAQINLIPNSQFEFGSPNNRDTTCKYISNVHFNSDIQSWKEAIVDNNSNRKFPQWIDLSIIKCGEVLVGSNNIH